MRKTGAFLKFFYFLLFFTFSLDEKVNKKSSPNNASTRS